MMLQGNREQDKSYFGERTSTALKLKITKEIIKIELCYKLYDQTEVASRLGLAMCGKIRKYRLWEYFFPVMSGIFLLASAT